MENRVIFRLVGTSISVLSSLGAQLIRVRRKEVGVGSVE